MSDRSSFIIYGAGDSGRKALHKIEQVYKDKVLCFFDTYKRGEIGGKTVIQLDSNHIDSIIIVANDNPYSVVEMYKNAISFGCSSIFWFLNFDDVAVNKRDFLIDECIDISDWGDCVMPDLEVHIADNCNLNCRGCTHFSPLYDSTGVDFEICKNDVIQLKNRFSGIGRLDILGGEPLLNSELEKYVISFKKMLPNTRISIFSNGILIPQLSDSILKTIADNKVAFMISLYPPTSKIMEKIKAKLKSFDIRYQVTPARDNFILPISTSVDTKFEKTCISNGCVSITGGKIARCPTLLYIHKYNEKFGEKLPEDGIYDIDNLPSGEAALNLMKKRVPLCDHCIYYEIPWSPCGRIKEKTDFSVDD